MNDFEWVYKAIVGVFGTTFSLFLESLSSTVSIIAGSLTAFYIYQQIVYMHRRRKHFYEEWSFRKKERENRITNIKKNAEGNSKNN